VGVCPGQLYPGGMIPHAQWLKAEWVPEPMWTLYSAEKLLLLLGLEPTVLGCPICNSVPILSELDENDSGSCTVMGFGTSGWIFWGFLLPEIWVNKYSNSMSFLRISYVLGNAVHTVLKSYCSREDGERESVQSYTWPWFVPFYVILKLTLKTFVYGYEPQILHACICACFFPFANIF
jgi:hypothetical protein